MTILVLLPEARATVPGEGQLADNKILKYSCLGTFLIYQPEQDYFLVVLTQCRNVINWMVGFCADSEILYQSEIRQDSLSWTWKTWVNIDTIVDFYI